MTSIQTKIKLRAESGLYHSTHMLITVMNLTSVSQQGESPCFPAPEPQLNSDICWSISRAESHFT